MGEAQASCRGMKLLSNPVYLARKMREVGFFNDRARGLSVSEVEEVVERRAKLLEPYASRLKGLVLDCACGYGPDMLALARLGGGGRELVGLDLAVEGLRLARDMLSGYNAHLVQGDACRLPFRDDAFNAVNVSGMLHHHPLSLVKLIVAEIARVLKPGGTLLIREPCPANEGVLLLEEITRFMHSLAHVKALLDELGGGERLRRVLHERFEPFGFGALYPSALRAVLEEAGFKVVGSEARRKRLDLDDLFKAIKRRIDELPATREEREFLEARLEELKEKARLIEVPGEDIVVVEAVHSGRGRA